MQEEGPGYTESIQNRLLANTLDLVFTEGFVDNGELDARVLGMDTLVVITAPTHPLFERTGLTAAELSKEPCILREAGSSIRALIERALRPNQPFEETRCNPKPTRQSGVLMPD